MVQSCHVARAAVAVAAAGMAGLVAAFVWQTAGDIEAVQFYGAPFWLIGGGVIALIANRNRSKAISFFGVVEIVLGVVVLVVIGLVLLIISALESGL